MRRLQHMRCLAEMHIIGSVRDGNLQRDFRLLKVLNDGGEMLDHGSDIVVSASSHECHFRLCVARKMCCESTQ